MQQLVQFDADDPEGLARGMATLDMHSPLVSAGFRYWNSRRRGRAVPARADLDPLIDIPRLVPNVMTCGTSRSIFAGAWSAARCGRTSGMTIPGNGSRKTRTTAIAKARSGGPSTSSNGTSSRCCCGPSMSAPMTTSCMSRISCCPSASRGPAGACR
ncbi:MAG: PAS domain-containing protein [Rhodospirillaceae bacterium]|nr:PAS domain-containing protein [Rhodospirillaceae bacterium]